MLSHTINHKQTALGNFQAVENENLKIESQHKGVHWMNRLNFRQRMIFLFDFANIKQQQRQAETSMMTIYTGREYNSSNYKANNNRQIN